MLPADGPRNVDAIKTGTDGNCLCHALSQSHSRDKSMHLELRAHIVIEGVIRKKFYLSDESLSRGATSSRNEPLTHLYVRYSDYYVNSQRITDNTVEYIYCRELHECAKVNSYMGLWQLAQAASVLNTPIQSVYPSGDDAVMRMDFNGLFFPVDCTPEKASELIMIMWTSVEKNTPPNHFVPLLTKRPKYAHFA